MLLVARPVLWQSLNGLKSVHLLSFVSSNRTQTRTAMQPKFHDQTLYRASIERELDRHGFRATASHRQFVLPIALHKRLGSARATRIVEGALSALGLLWLAGSPVTVAAERCGS